MSELLQPTPKPELEDDYGEEVSEEEEEEVEEEEFVEPESEDERPDWGFEKDEEIFYLGNLKFKPFTTALTDQEKYQDSCHITGNLNTNQFVRYLPLKKFRLTYYDKPYGEYCVQGKFLKDVDTIQIIDVDVNYDLIYHITEKYEVLAEIKSITLRNCEITEELLLLLCPKLEEAYFLTELDLSHNPIGDDGLKVIVKYLYYWTFLKHLSLFDTQITHVGLEKLATLFNKQRIFITRLNLGRNRLNNQNTVKKMFTGFIRKSTPLEYLILPNCSLQGAEMASHFEMYLLPSKRLKYLDLSFNLFSTNEEVLSLMGFFCCSKSMEELVLNFNPLNDQVMVTMLNRVFESQESEIHKTLYIENMTMPQLYFKEKWKLFNRPDIKVMVAGVRKINLPKVDNFKVKLVKRLNFTYKKTKPKRDVLVKTLEDYLPAKKMRRIKCDDFKDALMLIPRMDFTLVQEIVQEFSGGGPRANVKEFIDIYSELYPPKQGKPKKKASVDDKKKKKKKKGEEEEQERKSAK